MARYADRADAGRRLAQALGGLPADAVVLGLPRGGVVVAEVVADVLGAPLDVVVVRKLGAPGRRELAVGAVAEEGVRVLNDEVLAATGMRDDALERVTLDETLALHDAAQRYRGEHAPLGLAEATAVVVDDGIATGATVHAACLVARARGARAVRVAVPVAPRAALGELARVADGVVCPLLPRRFFAVGSFYADFRAVDDDAVVAIVRRHLGAPGA